MWAFVTLPVVVSSSACARAAPGTGAAEAGDDTRVAKASAPAIASPVTVVELIELNMSYCSFSVRDEPAGGSAFLLGMINAWPEDMNGLASSIDPTLRLRCSDWEIKPHHLAGRQGDERHTGSCPACWSLKDAVARDTMGIRMPLHIQDTPK